MLVLSRVRPTIKYRAAFMFSNLSWRRVWDAYPVLIGGYEFVHGSVIDVRR